MKGRKGGRKERKTKGRREISERLGTLGYELGVQEAVPEGRLVPSRAWGEVEGRGPEQRLPYETFMLSELVLPVLPRGGREQFSLPGDTQTFLGRNI